MRYTFKSEDVKDNGTHKYVIVPDCIDNEMVCYEERQITKCYNGSCGLVILNEVPASVWAALLFIFQKAAGSPEDIVACEVVEGEFRGYQGVAYKRKYQ
jgi:hypothetical protein